MGKRRVRRRRPLRRLAARSVALGHPARARQRARRIRSRPAGAADVNQLPEHRRALYGRTQRQMWRASDYDPIERPDSGDIGHAVVGWLALSILIVLVAVWIVDEFAGMVSG